MSTIHFDRVSKRYDGNTVIEALNLDVAEGELLALVGPSGCGKSTLLRLLAGLDEITSGEIRIDERRINEVPAEKRNVAMVFQNYALYPHMSVRRNLTFPLEMRRLPRAEIRHRVEDTAALLDLTPLLERRPAQLSGGQRQRVAMGRAIVRDARVFLMDEPLSNLDAKLRVQIRGEIARLQARLGTTTVYVTHDQVEAMTLGHRVALLRDGRLQQVAEPRRIYQRPANIFVAGFIGNPGMNLFRARLMKANGKLAIDLGETLLPLSEETVERHPGIDGWCGRELVVGIRPEAITLAGADRTGVVSTRVRDVESLGHETIVHSDCGLKTLTPDREITEEEPGAAAPPLTLALPGHHPIKPGDRLSLRLSCDGLCLFDTAGELIGVDSNRHIDE